MNRGVLFQKGEYLKKYVLCVRRNNYKEEFYTYWSLRSILSIDHWVNHIQSVSTHISFGELSSFNDFEQEIPWSFEELRILEAILAPRAEILCCQNDGSETLKLAVYLSTDEEDNK